MKVIDLLNKMANSEELPHFIIDEQEYYVGADGFLKEFFGDDVEWTLDAKWLNEEVEIIEEDKDIDVLELQENISKLQSEIDLLSNEIGSYHNKIHSMRDRNTYMKETLKDLQKTVNELKGKYE